MQSQNANKNLHHYILRINTLFQQGNATEHTYRGYLSHLLETLVPEVRATNEPKRQTCGAPDYILTKKDIPVGFIEAKDIGDKDLEGKKKSVNKEQFDRYKASLDNLIFTDYIDFHLYNDGEFVTKIAIAELTENGIVALPQNFERFVNLIKDFCVHVGQTIKSSKKLAEMMAGKARLLSDVIEKSLNSDDENQENSTLKEQMLAFKQILIHDITAKGFADVYAQTIACGTLATFRTSDSKVIQHFAKKGLQAQVHYEAFEGLRLRHIHSKPYDASLPTLYFVHGAPGSSDNFDAYLTDSLLNTKANLISFDRLGYGYSEFGCAHPDIAQQAGSLIPQLKQCSSKELPGILIGWSYGGPIAAKMALEAPEIVAAVVMLAPALDPEAERYFALGKLAEWKLTEWMVPLSFRVAQIEKRFHAAALRPLVGQWKNIQVPVLMLHGSKDKLVPYAPNVAFAQKHFSNTQFTLHRVVGKGHVFPMQETEMVKKVLLGQ